MLVSMQQNANSFKENVPYVTGLSWNSVKNDPFEIFLDNELIQNVKKQKLLGVIIDNNLSWSEQIDSLSKHHPQNYITQTPFKVH